MAITAKILHVNLTSRTTRTEEIAEATYRKYLGGGALAAHILLRDMKPAADPLGPDNVLVFMTSVINGLSLSGTNRYTAAAKSPLTGGYGESEAGGWWGPELRAAGWDGVVVHGASATPVYLWIKDDKVEFRDATPYWGKLSGEVQDGIETELGDRRVRTLQCGISGEQGVRFAAIVNQLKHFHGRGGLGAVMGSKNLKAIVVRGSKTLAATGSLCGINDLNALALINQLYAQYVLDSISTGAVIAFAMECFEQGIITREMAGGLELTWGNVDAVIELIHQIGRRESFLGRLLGEGVKRAAKELGKGAERFALHVKGQELPMHDPRGKKGLSLAYAISPTGADHMEAPHDPLYAGFHPQGHPLGVLGLIEPLDPMTLDAKKVRAFFVTQQVWSAYNSVGMCDFVGAPLNALQLQPMIDYINSVTGWNMSLYELMKVGERNNTLARMFNVREGFTPDDDVLPQRMHEGIGNGALKGSRIDPQEFLAARKTYYEMAGWDPQTGKPTDAKLAELGIS